MKPTVEEILAGVRDILTQMTGDWDGDALEIGPRTRLSADLGLSSIDALHLVASIDMRFNRRLPYEKLILKDGRYVEDLSVGELARFVHEHFDEDAAGPRPA